MQRPPRATLVFSLFALAAVSVLVLKAQPAIADVKLHPLFTDGAVLQQGVDIPVWGTAEPGEKVSCTIDFGKTAVKVEPVTADKDGKWKLVLPKVAKGGPYTMTVAGNNVVTVKDMMGGEVWVASGQSNMQWSVNQSEEPAQVKEKASYPKVRLFSVPRIPAAEPQSTVNARWVECSPKTVGDFSAVAYHFGRALHEASGTPIGMIHSSWGGTVCEAWTPLETLDGNPDLKRLGDAFRTAKEKGTLNHNTGSALYNGMIHPLLPYPVKGAIWYQGESNAGRAHEYRTLFPAMIQSWRDAWKNPDLVFLFVQLAPFGNGKEPTWPELREAQFLTTKKLKNTGMAVITDLGDKGDIHPKPKAPVGERLALAARGIAYGEKIEYSGPIYDGLKVDGNKAILTFTHQGKGLECKDETLKGFTICGEDKVFHDAKAEIKGDKVVVSCDKVEKPVAVRYGWANFPVVNLYNKDGLPATPFRTDDFPLVTAPKAK